MDLESVARPSPVEAIVNGGRPNAFTPLGPTATHARLFDEQFESIEARGNESMAISRWR